MAADAKAPAIDRMDSQRYRELTEWSIKPLGSTREARHARKRLTPVNIDQLNSSVDQLDNQLDSRLAAFTAPAVRSLQRPSNGYGQEPVTAPGPTAAPPRGGRTHDLWIEGQDPRAGLARFPSEQQRRFAASERW
jgi:hypothetical protein